MVILIDLLAFNIESRQGVGLCFLFLVVSFILTSCDEKGWSYKSIGYMMTRDSFSITSLPIH